MSRCVHVSAGDMEHGKHNKTVAESYGWSAAEAVEDRASISASCIDAASVNHAHLLLACSSAARVKHA